MKFSKQLFLTFFALSLLSPAVFAQSTALVNLAQAEINKRGLTQTEVQARLSEEGINVNSISPAEYPKYQKQILSILDQMQKEKQLSKEVTTNPANNDNPENLSKPEIASKTKVLMIPETTPEEYVAEAEQRELQIV